MNELCAKYCDLGEVIVYLRDCRGCVVLEKDEVLAEVDFLRYIARKVKKAQEAFSRVLTCYPGFPPFEACDIQDGLTAARDLIEDVAAMLGAEKEVKQ